MFDSPASAKGAAPAGRKTATDSVPLQGRASGLTAADYRRAEGVAFFVDRPPGKPASVADVPTDWLAALVTPGDATGSLPEVRVTRDAPSAADAAFRTFDTAFESTTVSGYTVERKARTRVTLLSDGRVYALAASCSAVRWKKIRDSLDVALDSFNVFLL